MTVILCVQDTLLSDLFCSLTCVYGNKQGLETAEHASNSTMQGEATCDAQTLHVCADLFSTNTSLTEALAPALRPVSVNGRCVHTEMCMDHYQVMTIPMGCKAIESHCKVC